MVKFCVLAVLFAVYSSTFALNGQYSPVLIFKHKENTKTFEKNLISSITKVNQAEFERRFVSLDAEQKIVFIVARDLSPEAFATRNDENTRAFESIAKNVDLVEYIPNVENAVNNKLTHGKDVAHVSVSTINEFEPKPSAEQRVIVATLPEYHDAESNFHYLARIDRACYAISQLEEYKDALFVLTSEMNSHLEELHSRKARDTSGQSADQKGIVKKDPNFLLYLTEFVERKDSKDTTITITEADISGSKTESLIKVTFKGILELEFKLDADTGYWTLEKATANGSKVQFPDVSVPKEFSYSCASSLFFSKSATDGWYFRNFQIELNYDGATTLSKFNDAYDCIGFTSGAIWSGLFITLLLLAIVSVGITYIMDIRTMDRFDDPKGKTITVTASD